MAQSGFMFSDEGRTLSVLNDSTTSTILAGEICYVVPGENDNVLTQTSSTARAAYASTDVKVKSIDWGTTANIGEVLGVALEDAPAGGKGAIAMEGLFIHQVIGGVEAGGPVQAAENGTNKVNALGVATTTVGVAIVADKCGRFITGASGANEFVVWKLSL